MAQLELLAPMSVILHVAAVHCLSFCAGEGGGPFDTPAGEHSPVLRISRQNSECHKYLVTGVCWLPHRHRAVCVVLF